MEININQAVKSIEKNGYTVDTNNDIYTFKSSFGVLGRIKITDESGEKREKYLLYTCGNEYEKGFLTGYLTEKMVSKMTNEYVNNFIWDFTSGGPYKTNCIKTFFGKIMAGIVYLFSKRIKKDIPQRYHDEMKGILDGCRKKNKHTRVKKWRIWVLNTGIDAILSVLYTGKLGFFRPLKLTKRLKIPVMCHGFSASSSICEKKEHFFGRDFMFPTAGVFQKFAAQIVHNQKSSPLFTGISAPGFIGLMTGMNEKMISAGVDMVAGSNCNPKRPGFNSLLMIRKCIDSAGSLEEAVTIVQSTQRGVSWLYLIADGKNETSCIIEAGAKQDTPNFTKNIPRSYRPYLPDDSYIQKNLSTDYLQGIMIRYQGYKSGDPYLEFNPGLFQYYKKKHPLFKYVYNQADFGKTGMLDKNWDGKNCPGARYFNPQREELNDLVLLSNTYIVPEMKLYSMTEFTNLISEKNQDDFQWRYDMLNKLLQDELKKSKKLSFERARDIISFLDPKFSKINNDYYIKKFGRKTHIPIEGSISICRLKTLYMETKVGYFEDPWIKLNLPDFKGIQA